MVDQVNSTLEAISRKKLSEIKDRYPEVTNIDQAMCRQLTDRQKRARIKQYSLDLSWSSGKGSRIINRWLKEIFPPHNKLHEYIPNKNTTERHIQKDKEYRQEAEINLTKIKVNYPPEHPLSMIAKELSRIANALEITTELKVNQRELK